MRVAAAALLIWLAEIPLPAQPVADPSPAAVAWRSVKAEAKRYAKDSLALVTAPARWHQRDWEKAAAVGLVLGGLMLADREIDRGAIEQRSEFTDRVSDATTGLGGAWGQRISAGILLAGWASRSTTTRDTGRDALEAAVLSSLLSKYVFKPLFGRERPGEAEGHTVFSPGSGDNSFPSSHATQAFAVASVVAMRSEGWVIPTLAYTAATLVAFDRVNDRAHFASDVAAGAVLGTAVGRFLVRRHQEAEAANRFPDVVPIRSGLGLRWSF